MISIINSWWFNLIGYLVCVVVFSQYYKLAVRNAKKDGAATILLQLTAGISILLLAPFLSFRLPSDPKIYLLLIVINLLCPKRQNANYGKKESSSLTLCNLGKILNNFFDCFWVYNFQKSICY